MILTAWLFRIKRVLYGCWGCSRIWFGFTKATSFTLGLLELQPPFTKHFIRCVNILLQVFGTGQASGPILHLAILQSPVSWIGWPSQAFPPLKPYVKVSFHTAYTIDPNLQRVFEKTKGYCEKIMDVLFFTIAALVPLKKSLLVTACLWPLSSEDAHTTVSRSGVCDLSCAFSNCHRSFRERRERCVLKVRTLSCVLLISRNCT